MILLTSPISAGFLIAAAALLVSIALPAIRAQREAALKE
jgi:TctA family transporter